MDYRRFLGKTDEVVAPVIRRRAWLSDRSLRIDAADGWWRLRVRGRTVETLGPAAVEDSAAALAKLEAMRGHVIPQGGGFALVHGGNACSPLDLVPSDEDPPLLAPARARRHPLGELVLWDGVEWEGETEEPVRRALEEGRGIDDVRGVAASLRAAFAFATVQPASRALGIPAAPLELRRWIAGIASGGRPAAEAALRELAAEREAWARRVAAEVEAAEAAATAATAAAARTAARAAARPAAGQQGGGRSDANARVEESLRGSGAELLSVRRSAAGLLEVRFRFAGQRFVSIVEEDGLRVRDAGVCLDGQQMLVTLDSLPGVIRQAIDEDELVVTRHDGE